LFPFYCFFSLFWFLKNKKKIGCFFPIFLFFKYYKKKSYVYMCIMCLIQTLNNYEISICKQCHSTPIVSLSTLHSSTCY
jgi:hypothetical protein